MTAALAVATAVAAILAALAETRRFTLLLRGRTRVLDAAAVHASDIGVTVTGLTVLGLGLVTALVALHAVPGLYAAAARRAGRTPARSGASIVARLAVPGWNLHGAGQVLTEISGLLRAGEHRVPDERADASDEAGREPDERADTLGEAGREPDERADARDDARREAPGAAHEGGDAEHEPGRAHARRPARAARVMVPLWWLVWALNGALVLVTAMVAWGRSDQLMADTVELHIAVDVVAAVVAALFAAILIHFRRVWLGGPSWRRYAKWQVRPSYLAVAPEVGA